MFAIRLLLLLLQVFLFKAAQATSPATPLSTVPITLTENTNLTLADHDSASLANSDNDVRLFFAELGSPIPPFELRHALAVANANAQSYLPYHADKPISKDLFETNTTFPDTGDYIYLWVYAFGWGLSWRQLSQALMMLQNFMLGMGPGHPTAHCQQLEFYIQLTAGHRTEVARGVVEYTPGARAVAKRHLVTTTPQLLQANPPSQDTSDPPIIYHLAKTNLDLNVTKLGLPIPETIVLAAIESAFSDIILNHIDIDDPIPANRFPYSFNKTSGTPPHTFTTEIVVAPYPGQEIYWGLLCILYYGLRDFMVEMEHFNVMQFELIDARLGKLGHGEVSYWPSRAAPSMGEITSMKERELE